MCKLTNPKNYKYKVFYSTDDCGYVGICYQFPGLSVVADTKELAEKEIKELVRFCVEDMRDNGEALP